MPVVAADYPLLDAMWTMLVFFGWVIWFWLLIVIFGDLFRRRDLSGWGKAGWTVLVVFLPFIGVLTYMIAQGSHMTERRLDEAQSQQAQFDSYVRSVAVPSQGGPADQIAKAQEMLASGTITQEEFEAIKRKAIAA